MPAAKQPKLYAVRRSSIHGRGVFATADIARGTRIVEYKGKLSTWDEAMERPDSDPDDSAHTFLFEIDDGRVIDARVRGNAARWINHSCAPNCVTHENEDGHVFIDAKKAIAPGTELSYDYRLTIDGKLTKSERAQYACRCGAAKCRGTLLHEKPKKAKKAKKAGKKKDGARKDGKKKDAAKKDGKAKKDRKK